MDSEKHVDTIFYARPSEDRASSFFRNTQLYDVTSHQAVILTATTMETSNPSGVKLITNFIRKLDHSLVMV
jgi:hypothetical protein